MFEVVVLIAIGAAVAFIAYKVKTRKRGGDGAPFDGGDETKPRNRVK